MNSKKSKYLETTVPFSGFYESMHHMRVEEHYIDPELPQEERGRLLDKIDWKKAETQYSRNYVDMVSKLLGFELKFKSMVSPSQYNCVTDRIFAEISREDYEKLKARLVDEPLMEEYVKRRFTSCPGFMSSYSNCWDDWLDQEEEFDHNQIGAMIDCYLDITHGTWWARDNLYEFDVE